MGPLKMCLAGLGFFFFAISINISKSFGFSISGAKTQNQQSWIRPVGARGHAFDTKLYSMIMTEENVEECLSQARQELGTLFGYSAENRNVGITGEVEFVELDGPVVVLNLSGRFWHERKVVLSRVANFIQNRIPECVEVTVADPAQLDDQNPDNM
mmetsp:Transcript_44073/g.76132  ORF Transcript_44073/g.76132 Transcript_44073/m.76132 type:complete len:156 (+) Transcript_44073:73-540(+)